MIHIFSKNIKTSTHMNTLISEHWLPLEKKGRKKDGSGL